MIVIYITKLRDLLSRETIIFSCHVLCMHGDAMVGWGLTLCIVHTMCRYLKSSLNDVLAG